uniref:autotransporter outer membrane beta-barrel domain-containing protein n=1 Tax=Castellaniella defragrans TaxID=75697 RepID=UPI003341D622
MLLVAGAILPLTLLDSAAWADCTQSGAAYICSGVISSRQALTATSVFNEGNLEVVGDATFSAALSGAQVLNLRNEIGDTSLELVDGSNLKTTAAVLVSSNTAGTTTMVVGGNLTSTGAAGIRIDEAKGGFYFTQLASSEISSTAATGTYTAIAVNQEDGISRLDVDGKIHSQSGTGIKLALSKDAGDAIIIQGENGLIDARQYGINVNQKGAAGSAIDVDLAGQVNSRYLDSVHLENAANSGDITFTQQASSSIHQSGDGAGYGVALENWAAGSSTTATILGSIITTGAKNMAAVRADMLDADGRDIIIRQGSGSVIDSSESTDSTNYNSGIATVNKGTGDTVIVADGRVSGIGNGIYGSNYNSDNGGYGSGNISITTSSDVSGKTKNAGVLGLLYQDDTAPISATLQIVQTAGSITGAASGIETKNLGSGPTIIDVAGTVTGGGKEHGETHNNVVYTTESAGIFTDAVLGSEVIITLRNGANVSSASGIAIKDYDGALDDHGGNAIVTLESGASVTGSILLAAGSDRLSIGSAFDTDGITEMDGGDGVSAAGGMIDTLTFQGGDRAIAGSIIKNWENVVLDGGKLSFTDASLTTGSEPDMGLSILNGATLDGKSAFTLTGNMYIGAGSSFANSGAAGGMYSVSGDMTNAGAVALANGTSGDRLSVAGSYSGQGGLVILDTVLGDDTSMTDKLVIAGNTSGASLVRVVNVGGQGAQTAEGIEIISVGGQSNGTFSLVGDYLVAGAYTYRLHKDNASGTDPNDWYLRSELSSGQPEYHVAAPVYESYAQALLGLNGVGTLQQRVGNRGWSAQADGGASTVDGGGAWARVQGTHSRLTPRRSTTGTRYDQEMFKLQVGVDHPLLENAQSTVIGSVFAQYVHGNTRTRSADYARGRITTDGYGLGGAVTWYGNSGFYVDGVAQWMWFNSDLSTSAAGGALKDGNRGMGYALSAEAGKRYAIAPNWSLTPQAQLTASRVDFDDFQDRFGSTVRLSRGDSVEGRLGVTLDYETSQSGANGAVTSRTHVYGIANLYHEFRDGTRVRIEDVGFESKTDRLRGGVGVGGSHNWNKGKYSLYGEVLANTSLRNFGDSYSVNGTVGVRLMW